MLARLGYVAGAVFATVVGGMLISVGVVGWLYIATESHEFSSVGSVLAGILGLLFFLVWSVGVFVIGGFAIVDAWYLVFTGRRISRLGPIRVPAWLKAGFDGE